jgi:hypothetical protein
MLAILLEEGPEDFETREHIAFAFHWVERDGFGAIINEGKKIGTPFLGLHLVRTHVRVDELARGIGTVGGASFEGFSMHL